MAWAEWRETLAEQEAPRQPPHDLSTRAQEKYDELCGCCELREQGRWKRFVRDSETPG